MAVENNNAIAIAAFIDWLIILAPIFQLMTSKAKTNRIMFEQELEPFFPRFQQVTGIASNKF